MEISHFFVSRIKLSSHVKVVDKHSAKNQLKHQQIFFVFFSDDENSKITNGIFHKIDIFFASCELYLCVFRDSVHVESFFCSFLSHYTIRLYVHCNWGGFTKKKVSFVGQDCLLTLELFLCNKRFSVIL